MRLLGLCLAIIAGSALPAWGAIGDQWILGIHHLDNESSFTTNAGAGYSGPQSSGNPNYIGNSYGRGGNDGVARVYWELSGNSIGTNRQVPTTAELYTIEYFGTAQPEGRNDFQPIESQYHGQGHPDHGGELFPVDNHIPWNGAFGQNHQFIASNTHPIAVGSWNTTGPGPQTPNSSAPGAGPAGIYMWLTSGSWLYAKWNFGFAINRNWSAIRLTQITGDAPPPPPEGDYNHDGTVDAADYIVWKKQIYPDADGNGDTIIDVYDYYLWKEDFGEPGSGSSSQVPEPAGAALALTGLLGIVLASRQSAGRKQWAALNT
jgi:hypothetical protein